MNGEIECRLLVRALAIRTGLPSNFPMVVPAEVRCIQVDDDTMPIDVPQGLSQARKAQRG